MMIKITLSRADSAFASFCFAENSPRDGYITSNTLSQIGNHRNLHDGLSQLQVVLSRFQPTQAQVPNARTLACSTNTKWDRMRDSRITSEEDAIVVVGSTLLNQDGVMPQIEC